MELHKSNKKAWDQAAISYERSIEDTVDLLKNGSVSMCRPELHFLKDLRSWCDLAIHLQCAGGEDTLSLLNLGARRVIGLDISDKMIKVANTTAHRLELQSKASWVCCDVLDTPKEFNGSADLIYTGRGSIIWIQDLERWAHTIVRLLKPGGRFYMFEGHPMTYFFDMKTSILQFDSEFEGYFSKKIYSSKGWSAEYVGNLDIAPEEIAEKYERVWPTSEVINALIDQGLRLVRFEEYSDAYWAEFPNLPENERMRFPNTYSILMNKDKN